MLGFIFNSLIYILAIYGFIELIKEIFKICTYTNMQSDGIYFIIATKNQENKIEYFVRTTLFRIIYGKEELVKNIIIADLNSQDETKNILDKLSEEYEFIKVVNWNECKEIIDNIGDT